MYYDVIDEELEQKLNDYRVMFSDIFPLAQFDGNRKELIEEIDKCIRIKKEYDTSFWDEHPDYDD